ncbi:hypothetical protein ACFY8C_39675 [Streptomyces flavochromogenes]|uniref:Transposase n=1 Tax=Streptomyces flavochromogenes TaxID=68199 RepID=A0ABW6Y3K9_9ACTN
MISADEKTSIQARCRCHPTLAPGQVRAMRVDHAYGRGGALAYLAAHDVHRAKVFVRFEPTTGIGSFMNLVTQVMSQEPYASAKRVFWIVDNGSSHRGKAAAARLTTAFPNAVLIRTRVRASWLTKSRSISPPYSARPSRPTTSPTLAKSGNRLRAFEDRYNATAQPFQWKFTTSDLDDLLARLGRHAVDHPEESLPRLAA